MTEITSKLSKSVQYVVEVVASQILETILGHQKLFEVGAEIHHFDFGNDPPARLILVDLSHDVLFHRHFQEPDDGRVRQLRREVLDGNPLSFQNWLSIRLRLLRAWHSS